MVTKGIKNKIVMYSKVLFEDFSLTPREANRHLLP